jgi:hypothetical protein
LISFSRSVGSDQYSASYDSVNVRLGSRLCENYFRGPSAQH